MDSLLFFVSSVAVWHNTVSPHSSYFTVVCLLFSSSMPNCYPSHPNSSSSNFLLQVTPHPQLLLFFLSFLLFSLSFFFLSASVLYFLFIPAAPTLSLGCLFEMNSDFGANQKFKRKKKKKPQEEKPDLIPKTVYKLTTNLSFLKQSVA